MKNEEYYNKMITRLNTEVMNGNAAGNNLRKAFLDERNAHAESRQWSKIMFWILMLTIAVCGVTMKEYSDQKKEILQLKELKEKSFQQNIVKK